MNKLQSSIIGKLVAWALLLSLSFTSVSFAFIACSKLRYLDADNWQDTSAFALLIKDNERQLAELLANQQMLEGNTLNYMQRQQLTEQVAQTQARMTPDGTSLRYQIKSADGSKIIDTNVAEGETLSYLVKKVHYTLLQYEAPTQEAMDAGQIISYSTHSMDTTFSYASRAYSLPTSGEGAVLTHVFVLEYGVPDVPSEGADDSFSQLYLVSQEASSDFNLLLAVIATCGALALICLGYVLWTAGHKRGVDGIFLGWQDHIFFDLYLVAMMGIGIAFAASGILMGAELWYVYDASEYPSAMQLTFIMLSIATLATATLTVAALTLRTFAVRCKARALVRTTLCCRVIGFIGRVCRDFMLNLPLTWRLILAFFIYLTAEVMLDVQFGHYNPIPTFLLNATILLVMCWWTTHLRRLKKGCQAIAAGNLNHQIDTTRMPYDLKSHAEALNNISVGLSSAVDEKMKSERFKAELITNVSHDLKTPLTSIINYVNLLKGTQQSDPTALEYIEVLDRKSQRLKKLTEDLVEASKASTGVLTASREKIGMTQLIDQALGEWSEKLEERQLLVVSTLPETETWVYADGRHLWRVVDNLLSNCAKYAMEGTRVYLDLTRGHGKITLSVKNISRDPLNVPSERLMERFVRGDVARTTEGSGLGLSIARSLTELQGGTFDLIVDGDLFKATVTLSQAN